MPQITDMQIHQKDKTRANVYLDGEFAFALEMVTVMRLGLKIGAEVSAEVLAEAVFDTEKSVAFGKAVDYLARGMKTVKQTTDYLQGKGYSPQVVEYVIDKLLSYGYLNDEAYAKAYSLQNSGSKGSRRISQELMQRGVGKDLAQESSMQEKDFSLQKATLLAGKYMRGKVADVKNCQRLQRYLLSRGYDYDVTSSVVRSYRQQNEVYDGSSEDYDY